MTRADTEAAVDSGPAGDLDVAVIGLAGRFAAAESIDAFWQAVRAGDDLTSRFSEQELDGAGVSAQERARSDRVGAGGVLDGAELFDARFFGYSPRDAAILDPQQRLFLECAWWAMEDAGYTTDSFPGLVGVFGSAGANTYLISRVAADPGLLARTSLHELLLGNDKDTLATRVAYHLDLEGPAVAVQSACSSSLVAVHLAAQALIGRECDLALAGGVSVHFPQREGYRYQRGGVLSPDGRCRPFDARANGTVNGDGVGAVVLKRLAEAIEDGDLVHAVVRGSAVNNDGARKVGFTAPRVDGQREVIRTAQLVAGVDPRSIRYIETHGTGTALGDPIEFAALSEAFADEEPQTPGRCALGSLKALTGHMDAAAGVAGFLKCVLAVRDGVIPPNPYFEHPNEAIDLAASPFRIPTAAEPWPETGGPRRAAVSSFGMGGTNCHVILEQAPAVRPARPSTRTAHVVPLSGATPRALDAVALRLARHLEQHPDEDLADVAFTAQVGRRPLRHRRAIVAGNAAEAIRRLREPAAARPAERDAGGELRDRPVVLMFPGQGTQYPQMCRKLYEREPAFREAFDLCADLAAGALGADLRTIVYGEAENTGPAAVNRPGYTQAALFSVEYAMARLWLEWGVRPWALIGHSLGEYVAATLAGVFELEDALRLVAVRGRLMESLPEGVMHSVSLDAKELADLLPEGVSVAAHNGPELSVASGPPPEMAQLTAALDARGVRHRSLRTVRAFHSAAVDPVLAEFREQVRRAPLAPPRMRIASNVTGEWLTAAQAVDPEYWVRHLREPVLFARGAALLLRDGDQILLEVGPGSTLSTLVERQTGRGGPHTVVPLCPSGEDADHRATEALARLFVVGATLDWAGHQAHESRHRVSLPGYPFERAAYWIGPHTAPRPESADGGIDAEAEAEADARATPADESPAERVRRAWSELLGIAALTDSDDFFQLGGHSLLANHVIARLSEELAVQIPLAALFEAPNLGAFTSDVEQLIATALPRDLLAEVEELSDEELRALLAEATDAADD